jgi:hypothetical protein
MCKKQRSNIRKRSGQEMAFIDKPPVTYFLQTGRKFYHLPIVYPNF